MNKKTITIFGTSRAKEGDKLFALAFDLGAALAAEGFTIANGGYAGTMLASSKGANSNNGKVIGVTCRAFKSDTPNQFVTKNIVTDSLEQRLKTLIDLADAFIVLQGGTGTLLELANTWELKNKGFFTVNKPIVLLGDFWRPLIDLIKIDDPESQKYLNIAKNAKDVINIITAKR